MERNPEADLAKYFESKPYSIVAAEIKISDNIVLDRPTHEMEEELVRRLIYLGRNGFIVEPGFSKGRWLTNSGGTYYDTALLYEKSRENGQNELRDLGVMPHSWPFPDW